MALRIAVPNYPIAPDVAPAPPPANVRERRANLEAYLALDPAIRFLIALALVAAISLLYLVQASNVTELNYDVQRAAAAHTKLVQDRQQLQLQIARAQSLPQIEQVARTQLKMTPMGDQYRYLDVGAAETGGAAGAARAAPAAP
jgi:cell division protein FtsL